MSILYNVTLWTAASFIVLAAISLALSNWHTYRTGKEETDDATISDACADQESRA